MFGVELEFMAPSVPIPEKDRPTFSTRVAENLAIDHCHHRMAQAFQDAGLKSGYVMDTFLDEFQSTLFRAAPAGSINGLSRVMNIGQVGEKRFFEPNYWVVKTEPEIRNNGQGHVGVEVNTPIMSEDEATAGYPIINLALDSVKEAYEGRIYLDQRCGMHVHVSVDGNLPLLFAKRVEH